MTPFACQSPFLLILHLNWANSVNLLSVCFSKTVTHAEWYGLREWGKEKMALAIIIFANRPLGFHLICPPLNKLLGTTAVVVAMSFYTSVLGGLESVAWHDHGQRQ